jgi:hypothetical protein
MHIYLAARGVKHQIDLWESLMVSQFYPWSRKNLKTGEEEKSLVQGALRPIRFYEYVFPEEHYDQVIQNITKGGELTDKRIRLPATLLRKALGADKAKPAKKNTPITKIMAVDSVGVEIIGTKKDNKKEWKEAGYEQELL